MNTRTPRRPPSAREHVSAVVAALGGLDRQLDLVEAWGRQLASVLRRGGCLITCGDPDSGAPGDLADGLRDLASRAVGPFWTIPLAPDGADSPRNAWSRDPEIIAREILERGRPGDVLLAVSTAGRTAALLAAARTARQRGLRTLALTGPGPNPLAELAHESVRVPARSDGTVREVHGTLARALCAGIDRTLAEGVGAVSALPSTRAVQPGPRRPRVSSPPGWPDAAVGP